MHSMKEAEDPPAWWQKPGTQKKHTSYDSV